MGSANQDRAQPHMGQANAHWPQLPRYMAQRSSKNRDLLTVGQSGSSIARPIRIAHSRRWARPIRIEHRLANQESGSIIAWPIRNQD